MNETEQAFIDALPDEQADRLLVQLAGAAMQRKLEIASVLRGRGGWHRSDCSEGYLRELLAEHVVKGDLVDVMNLAAMIYARQQLYGKRD